MQAAFDLGADAVEFDVKCSKDNQLAVFHDSTLLFRCGIEGEVQDYTMAELKQMDVEYGYTADKGKTYPLRGKGFFSSWTDHRGDLKTQAFKNEFDEVLNAFRLRSTTLYKKHNFSSL